VEAAAVVGDIPAADGMVVAAVTAAVGVAAVEDTVVVVGGMAAVGWLIPAAVVFTINPTNCQERKFLSQKETKKTKKIRSRTSPFLSFPSV
jgi:hypothetical protein